MNHPFLFIYSWELFRAHFRRRVSLPPLAEQRTHRPNPFSEFCLRSSLAVISLLPSVCLWCVSFPFSGPRLRVTVLVRSSGSPIANLLSKFPALLKKLFSVDSPNNWTAYFKKRPLHRKLCFLGRSWIPALIFLSHHLCNRQSKLHVRETSLKVTMHLSAHSTSL